MLALWLVLTALACSAASGATSPDPLRGDDVVVQKIDDIITSANNYLTDHLLTTLSLPNIGVLPLDPVKLTEGKISQFNTIQLAGTPIVNQKQNPDGSATYTFDINLSLNVVLVQYQFHATLLGLFSQDGQLVLSPQNNALRLQGIIVVGPGTYCDARVSSGKVIHFENFQMDIEPSDIPFVSKISETILNYVSPKLQWVVNSVINVALFSSSYQRYFSDLVCNTIKSK